MSFRQSEARKRLGQVFLRDPQTIGQILAHAALQSSEHVLEIGPGQGALTGSLAQAAAALYALEIDPYYVAFLQRLHLPHTTIIQSDARLYDYALLPAPLVVVANLPYSTGIAILQRLLSFRGRFSRLILMLQQEVVDRLLAAPGSSAYGSLSVMVQYYAMLQPCLRVSRDAFTPVPAVDSAVIALYPFTVLPHVCQDTTLLWQVVRCAFSHRRKVLRSNLLSLPGRSMNRADVAAIFAALQLHDNVRAQEVSVAQFVQLTNLLMAPHPS